MSAKRRAPRHGDVVAAPDEGSVAFEESPQPPVTRSTPPGAPAGGGLLARVWSLAKLGTGVLIVVGASVTVAWGAHHYALNTPRFAIRQVEVEGNVRLDERRVMELAALELGQNIFAVDTQKAEAQLVADPWVREVKITRELPNRLRVSLTEREAGALADIGGRLYLVTPSGEPFKVLGSGDPYDLPVVTGISAALLARDRGAVIERLQTGLRVVREYEALPIGRIHVAQEVHVADDGKVVLTVGKDGVALHLGQGPFKKPLAMAAVVMGKLAKAGQTPRIVFLDNEAHPERVVVRVK